MMFTEDGASCPHFLNTRHEEDGEEENGHNDFLFYFVFLLMLLRIWHLSLSLMWQ